MTITIFAPLVVSMVGLVTYALAANTKIAEIGRLAYACGLLVTLFELAGRFIKL